MARIFLHRLDVVPALEGEHRIGVDYIGFHDRGTLLAGGCGDANGPPRIGKTGHLEHAFGQMPYPPEEPA